MWYGSYWQARRNTTALGFAVSLDGRRWYKHPGNPVFRPDPERPWESHYATSQSVLPDGDGAWRMWYASRKAPPFRNKYFALNTARWLNAPGKAPEESALPGPRGANRDAFRLWQEETRRELGSVLGIPRQRGSLDSEARGRIELDEVIIEKWLFTSEPGSRVPALVYRPKDGGSRKRPGLVLTFGHGGSKSAWQYHYAGLMYARLGGVVLAMDPMGEEERNVRGRMGTRAPCGGWIVHWDWNCLPVGQPVPCPP